MNFEDLYYDQMNGDLPPWWKMVVAIVGICLAAISAIVPIAILIWLLY